MFPPKLVIEYCPKGNLRDHLRKVWLGSGAAMCSGLTVNWLQARATSSKPQTLDAVQQLDFIKQIATGMSQLAKQRIVLCDLAAFERKHICVLCRLSSRCFDCEYNGMCGRRNVLLTAQNICKISDFGLARDVNEDCSCSNIVVSRQFELKSTHCIDDG
jgi:serine/threonine protein kinase